MIRKRKRWLVFFSWFILALAAQGDVLLASKPNDLKPLLPVVNNWSLSTEPDFYDPETLFEYIDGASEAYLAYDFQGLLVAQYSREKGGEPLLTLEIYDMGRLENAFGIYSAERPQEANFINIGVEGYLEEGSLDFFINRYYIKILCFLEGKEANDAALLFGQEVVKRIPERGSWPTLLAFFPRQGIVPHSQKFIRCNFLGFSYLSHGYQVSYKTNAVSFEAFLIQTKDAEEAEVIEKRLLEDLPNVGEPVKPLNGYFHAENKYFQHIYLGRWQSIIYGLMRFPAAEEKAALTWLTEMKKLLPAAAKLN